ncbi:hypothetical protein JG688_00014818 [Phytophthora aleatoria]|uniref:Uncharacterized protein n=1 Tax=Phytophthora aleatoria TaxID=2496075 RepID=A0A8J5M039_9STRA|nr:hypothetical protein JG688_00014818 [Phytophthora aleatoria]
MEIVCPGECSARLTAELCAGPASGNTAQPCFAGTTRRFAMTTRACTRLPYLVKSVATLVRSLYEVFASVVFVTTVGFHSHGDGRRGCP